MKLTVRTIASVAGVSPASVSRYMNSKGTEVSEELCRKIEEGLRQLGAEESICRSQRRPIMILLSHLRFSFYSRVLRELLDQEERGEYIFFLVQHDPDSLETVKSFVRRIHPEGVIYFEEEIGGPILKYLQDSASSSCPTTSRRSAPDSSGSAAARRPWRTSARACPPRWSPTDR